MPNRNQEQRLPFDVASEARKLKGQLEGLCGMAAEQHTDGSVIDEWEDAVLCIERGLDKLYKLREKSK